MARQAVLHCFLCNKPVHEDTTGYVLSNANFVMVRRADYGAYRNNSYPTSPKNISFTLTGGKKFSAHKECVNRVLWQMDYPDLKLEDVHYKHLSFGQSENCRAWKIGDLKISNPTIEKLDKAMNKVAKKMLEKI